MKTLGKLAYAFGVVGSYFGLDSAYRLMLLEEPLGPKQAMLPIAAMFLVLSFLLAPAAYILVRAYRREWLAQAQKALSTATSGLTAIRDIQRLREKHPNVGIHDNQIVQSQQAHFKKVQAYATAHTAWLNLIGFLAVGAYLVFGIAIVVVFRSMS